MNDSEILREFKKEPSSNRDDFRRVHNNNIKNAHVKDSSYHDTPVIGDKTYYESKSPDKYIGFDDSKDVYYLKSTKENKQNSKRSNKITPKIDDYKALNHHVSTPYDTFYMIQDPVDHDDNYVNPHIQNKLVTIFKDLGIQGKLNFLIAFF